MQFSFVDRIRSFGMTVASASLFIMTVFFVGSVHANTVELTVTSSWVSSDFDVSSTGPTVGAAGIPEENDDKVFGVAPSDGSTTFTLRVSTPANHVFMTGDFGVTHNWYGYSNVELVGTHTFGSASWTTSSILTSLEGPNSTTAALWTDTDLSLGAPNLISFRMFGDWEGNSADLFIGSRSPTTISTSFLMWEYFGGEEIRNDTPFSARVTAVPEPSTMLLCGSGLAALGAWRYRKQKLA